jgi:hypothetical protein
MHDTQNEAPKQYQCRHIFTDGRRCASPCLRREEFCYYHHTTRRPVTDPRRRRSRRSTFQLPLPEDRSAIQSSIGEVLHRIASNDIDPRRAGLLLYGLQIASLNLAQSRPATKTSVERGNVKRETAEPEIVQEITIDPVLGVLAPRSEISKASAPKSVIAQLIEKLTQDEQKEADSTDATVLPTVQAAEAITASDDTPIRTSFNRHNTSKHSTFGSQRFSQNQFGHVSRQYLALPQRNLKSTEDVERRPRSQKGRRTNRDLTVASAIWSSKRLRHEMVVVVERCRAKLRAR